jgi:AbrB family looped-hinge helix DNA binding protein
MAKTAKLTTKVSSKGQVVLPKAVRDRRGWATGVELVVEERPEGVLLRAAPKKAPTRYEDVFGMLGPVDRVVTVEEMHQGVLEEARRRWLRKSGDFD